MHSSAATTQWFDRRNLFVDRTQPITPVLGLSREVMIYLLVTLAMRPHDLPSEVVVFLVEQGFVLGIGDA